MADLPSFTTDDLRAWMEALCTSLEAQGLTTFQPLHDHYWSLDVEGAFDLSREPEVLASQLSDDIEDLRGEVADVLEPDLSDHVIAFHFAEHLSGILGYVAFATGPDYATAPKSDTAKEVV
jgi:hypothetical protein